MIALKSLMFSYIILTLLWVTFPATAQTEDTDATSTEATLTTASPASGEVADIPDDSESTPAASQPQRDSDMLDASPQPPGRQDSNALKSDAAADSMTIEFAGPVAPQDNDSDANTSSSATKQVAKTSPEAPVKMNPFIALGDEMFLGIGFITVWGVRYWNWFEHSFHFKREFGFRQESSTGGADKTGHFYTSYIIADFLNWRLRRQGWPRLRSALVASSVAMGLMTWIEVGDATSAYGWSWEDILADFIGVAISAGLALSPTADKLLDFRVEYWPTSSYMDGGVMAADYSGMKYLMALRMSGFPFIKRMPKSPLRLVELHMGFYSRGFRTFDHAKETNRVLYFGVGLDLKELLHAILPKKVHRPFDVALSYYQVPYTSYPVIKLENRYAINPLDSAQFAPYTPEK
ncbi:MAG: DUF2279 domain-containing protein [Deltaproteobacteria bacterium]|nr:DUF2279 domain-containing protein [Deltaproteobacteria bacterium]